jgi:hypothetical protein
MTQYISFKTMRPYLAILLAVLVMFVVLVRMPAMRVGDGSEYYALFYAWAVDHRPWMSAGTFDVYDAYVKTKEVLGMVSRNDLVDFFPALRVGGTADFNHFWFYSLMAMIVAKTFGLVGIALTAHQAFVALHMAALGVTMAIGYRYYHWKGVLAVAIMLVASPMFWFTNKVHTEFLTICLILSGVILLRARRHLASALCIAIASTQNPSFALIACIPLFYRVVLQRKQPYRLIDVAMAVALVIAVLIHPVYYFSRYGVVTPQLLAGGVSMGGHGSIFYIWFLDPDVGLLPNWPLGLAVLLISIGMWVARDWVRSPAEPAPAAYGSTEQGGIHWIAFLALYTVINLYAHASTTNLNSGATPGLARYALWYLPLAFPLFMTVFKLFPAGSKRLYAGSVLLAAAAVVSVRVNNPTMPERYSVPSLASNFVQTHLPESYNPPWQIYIERYSGLGAAVRARHLRAVVGPDCAKMLVLPGPGERDATSPAACMYDHEKLNRLINDGPIGQAAAVAKGAPYYARLDAAEAAKLHRVVTPGRHSVGLDGDGGSVLGEGWSKRETWGAWSQLPEATLVLPCTQTGHSTLTLYLRPFHKQSISVATGAGVLWRGAITVADQAVSLQLGPDSCIDKRRIITLSMPDAVSPLQLGMSNDTRMLGVGLSAWDLQPRQ